MENQRAQTRTREHHSASLLYFWRVLKHTLFITAVCLVSLPASAAEPVFRFFPGTKVFPLFTADGLSHQLSLSRVTENREWIGTVGGSIPLIQTTVETATIQAGVAATIFNRLIKTPGRLTVVTVDYRVDFPVDVMFTDLAFRVALGHISCHFADDAIEMLGKSSIQHVNDYISLHGAYHLDALKGVVYSGFNYSYGTQPVQHRPWLLQFGADLGNIPVHEEVGIYGAFDVKIRQEVGWGSTRSVQAGLKLFPRSSYKMRIAYTLRMGYEERGQFYLDRTTMNLLSVFIDF